MQYDILNKNRAIIYAKAQPRREGQKQPSTSRNGNNEGNH